VDADDRGARTQIFGGKASEPETSRVSTGRKTQFLLSSPVFGALVGVILLQFRRDLLLQHETRLESLCYRAALFA